MDQSRVKYSFSTRCIFLFFLLMYTPLAAYAQNQQSAQGAHGVQAQFADTSLNISSARANLDESGRFISGPIDIPERRLIGLAIEDALAEFGSPIRVYSLRGEESWQDDVVFFYEDYLYLYWYENRVWQIRYDRRSQANFANLRMSTSKAEVRETFGTPHFESETDYFYNLLQEAYPIRLRLVFENNHLNDLYLYRSDF